MRWCLRLSVSQYREVPRLLPTALSALLLGAHSLRSGNLVLVASCAASPLVLLAVLAAGRLQARGDRRRLVRVPAVLKDEISFDDDMTS